jgi:dihydrofolate synthase/folylpolyglutamate synthase
MTKHGLDQIQETEILDYLTQYFGFEVFTPGLERTRLLYQSFIEEFKKAGVRVITVAGTNGKGQTAHTLTSLLALENKKVGLWTSPHILSIRERFLFSNSEGVTSEVSYTELKKAMAEGELFLKESMKGVKVSFYEFLFLVFLILAKKIDHLDYLVLEVGLGGRLDAVNHFDADCACITSISRDHQSILGTRYEQILSEKIAVARKNRPLFTNFSLGYLNTLTKSYVELHEILWFPIENDEHYFQANQKLAWSMFEFLEPTSHLTFQEGVAQLPLYKGRREIMTFEGKSLIFIGAHNIDGVRRMLQSYLESEDLIFPESLLVSFSLRPIGEVEVMLKSLVDFFQEKAQLTLTSFNHPKALDAESIQQASLKVNKGMLNFVFDWKSELKNTNSKTILVCGSYYFIGEVQRFISA